jgi:hypothetical protein
MVRHGSIKPFSGAMLYPIEPHQCDVECSQLHARRGVLKTIFISFGRRATIV